MKYSFRYYGKDDSVTLKNISEIPGVKHVVSAIYDVKPGDVWPNESIKELKKSSEDNGLSFDIVESVPVHEDIKLGKSTRDRYIDNYIENIRRLANAGVKVITYNFMPVFDWTRTDMRYPSNDGSTSLAYFPEQLKGLNPLKDDISLPGWDESYTKEELKNLLDEYSKITKEDLWNNLEYFLNRILPVCEELDVKMSIHPDDPPYDIFGLPRIITDEKAFDRLIKEVPSVSNTICFCTGSLGVRKDNDLVHMVDKYTKLNRISFMHVRNIIYINDGFIETSAYNKNGSLPIKEIIKTLVKNGYEGYIRPDHGRMIWDESGRPGYGLYDRALSLEYLLGLEEAFKNEWV